MALERQCQHPMEVPSKAQSNTPIQPFEKYSAKFQESQLAGDQEGPSLQACAPAFPAAIQLNQGQSIHVEAEPSIVFTIPQKPPNYSNLKPILMSEECIVMQPERVNPHAAVAYNYSSNNKSQASLPRDFSAVHHTNRSPVSVPPTTVIVVGDHGDGFSHERSNLVQPQVMPSPRPLQSKSDSSCEQLSQLTVTQNSSSYGQTLKHQQNNVQANSDTSMEPATLTNRSPQPHDESSTAEPIQEILITETPLANTNPPQAAVSIQGRHHSMLANRAANLANLLPTGTVLMFQSLIPSLSNNGKCELVNKVFVGSTIVVCAFACFLSSFTDSFYVEMTTAKLNKLYYGFATPKGLCIFNYDNRDEEEELIRKYLPAYKIRRRDYVHAFGSLIVFLVFAFSSNQVVSCYFPHAGESELAILIGYLPLVAGVLGSCLFSISPTKRKGIGYGDSTVNRVLT